MRRRHILAIAISAAIISTSHAQKKAPASPMLMGNQTMPMQQGLQPNPLLASPIRGQQQQGSIMGGYNSGMNLSTTQGGLSPQMGLQVSTQNQGMMVDPQLGLNDPMMGMQNPGMSQFQDPMATADAPGITNPFSIRSLVDNANAQVNPQQLTALQGAVQSYVDGNLGDARKQFTSITQSFGEGVATDRAYLGLAKIERAYGAYDVSRRILEGVIRKNRDYESIMLARRSYRDLQNEVNKATDASRQDMEMTYAAYKEISWWNIFSKIKAYNYYKDSKANYEAMMVSSHQFDPIFAQVNITTPVPGANQGNQQTEDPEVPDDVQNQIDNALTMDQLKAEVGKGMPTSIQQPTFLNPTGTNTGASTGITANQLANTATPAVAVQPEVKTPEKVIDTPPPTPAPAPIAAAEKPVSQMSMDEARAAYLDAYNKLKEALKGDDANLKRDLQQRYRSSLQRYNELRNQ